MPKASRYMRRQLRQSKRLLWYFLSLHRCFFCKKKLLQDENWKLVPFTLHHTSESRYTDPPTSGPAPIQRMRPAHVSCHARFHLLQRKKAAAEKKAAIADIKKEI
jgi:hypothetical protein